MTVITCHHIMFIYILLRTYIYIAYHILSLYLKIYIPHRPPSSLTIRPSYSCNCRHRLRCHALWVWLPAMKTMVAWEPRPRPPGRNPTNMCGFPLMCFLGEVPKEKTTSTTTNMLAKNTTNTRHFALKEGLEGTLLKVEAVKLQYRPSI